MTNIELRMTNDKNFDIRRSLFDIQHSKKHQITGKNNNRMQKYNLEDRLIDFSVMILDIVDNLPSGFAATHLGNQLIRSGTSPALNYGEVQSAVSKADFIHRMSICLKELRESLINMKILKKRGYLAGEKIDNTLNECDELIRIFRKSIQTAKESKEDKSKH